MPNRERTTHASTQTFGLALVTAALLSAAILTLVLFGGEDVAMFLFLTVVAGAVTVATWRFDRQWARALGLTGTAVALGGFFLGFGLFQIFSPIEFTLAVVYVLGWVLSTVGGIRAILASRRHQTGPTAREARLPRLALGAVVLAAVVSGLGFLLSRQTVAAADAAGATVLEMKAFEFDPASSTIDASTSVLVRNADPFAHDFTLDALGINEVVGPGGAVLVDFSTASPGTYAYVCTLHSSDGEGMVGTIVIGG